jgi:hypothetical protein
VEVRTTVTIEDSLLAQAKEVAARSHRTLSSVVEDALRESLARQSAPGDRPRVVIPVGGKSHDRPLVDILNREALAEVLGDNGLPDTAS